MKKLRDTTKTIVKTEECLNGENIGKKGTVRGTMRTKIVVRKSVRRWKKKTSNERWKRKQEKSV